jgi:hypothetical protein
MLSAASVCFKGSICPPFEGLPSRLQLKNVFIVMHPDTTSSGEVFAAHSVEVVFVGVCG